MAGFFISSLFIIYKLVEDRFFTISTKIVLLVLVGKILLASIFKFIGSLGIIFSLVIKDIFFFSFFKVWIIID